MSHIYPLATDAAAALAAPDAAARTRAEAETLAGERVVVALETEWLEVTAEAAIEMMDRADQGNGHGFVQRYEDSAGAPVLAVTYWKLAVVEPVKTPKKVSKKVTSAAAAPEPEAAPATEDHTDDLYFRSGRTKPKRKKGPVKDPNQLDLF